MKYGSASQPIAVLKTVVRVQHSDFTASDTTETIEIWNVPPRAQVIGVVPVLVETPDDDDGDLTNWSMEFGEDLTPDEDGFVTTNDYIGEDVGFIFSDEGACLSGGQGVMLSVSATTHVTATATIVGVDLDDAGIVAGIWDVYITYIQH